MLTHGLTVASVS